MEKIPCGFCKALSRPDQSHPALVCVGNLQRENARLRWALTFYAKGEHFEFCGEDVNAPETPSGEPENWECGGQDGHEYQFENGGVAREALK